MNLDEVGDCPVAQKVALQHYRRVQAASHHFRSTHVATGCRSSSLDIFPVTFVQLVALLVIITNKFLFFDQSSVLLQASGQGRQSRDSRFESKIEY